MTPQNLTVCCLSMYVVQKKLTCRCGYHLFRAQSPRHTLRRGQCLSMTAFLVLLEIQSVLCIFPCSCKFELCCLVSFKGGRYATRLFPRGFLNRKFAGSHLLLLLSFLYGVCAHPQSLYALYLGPSQPSLLLPINRGGSALACVFDR